MKKIKCLDCQKEFTAETSEEALNQMHPHYLKEHQEMMAKGNEESKKEWFQKFNQEWAKAPEA